ncbi:hypothetical protein K0M31_020040 [Melipona bicolor]|uniref:Uncharacterized protein n=1 Tax=Melipona bicolor TaxID=60889 RepID=A0AA40G1I4_9HYME|nr:hypothetical protein K0M31_020040 [Melipona bicolor]
MSDTLKCWEYAVRVMEGGGDNRGQSRGRRSSAKVTEDGRTVVATEETKEETTRLETKEVEGVSVGGGGGGGGDSSGVVVDDSGTISEHGDCSRGQKNNNSANNGVGVSGGGGGGGLSCRGGTLRLLRGLVEGPIGRVAARVHRWGTTGGVNPSAPSERECPGGEGTPRRNVLDATKNRRLMGANLTKQSRRNGKTMWVSVKMEQGHKEVAYGASYEYNDSVVKDEVNEYYFYPEILRSSNFTF